MQSFPADLRIVQSVETLQGAQDSLASINTTSLSPLAIVAVGAFNSLYMLQKDSTDDQDIPNVIAPAQGGPGRWFKYSAGAKYRQVVSLSVPVIPPQLSVDVSANVPGVIGSTDIVVFNLIDAGLPTGVTITTPRVTGLGTVSFRFTNVTGASTSSIPNLSLEVAVL